MSGWTMLILFAVGALVLLGTLIGWASREIKGQALMWLAGGCIAVAVLWAIGTVLMGVFSLQGLAYSLHLGPAGTLVWPTAVAITTWALIVETVAGFAWWHDYRNGRGHKRGYSHAKGWAWGHISGPARMIWHLVLALPMVVRDAAYGRTFEWPKRPRHASHLVVMLTELLITDPVYGVKVAVRAIRTGNYRRAEHIARPRTAPDAATQEFVDVEFTVTETDDGPRRKSGAIVPAPRSNRYHREDVRA